MASQIIQKNCRLVVKEISETGTFSGYASIYDIADYDDDIIASGAFGESIAALQDKGRMPAMLWQHDSATPIGVYTKLQEDEKGLYCEGQLCMDCEQGAEAAALLKMGALSGMSVGFMIDAYSIDVEKEMRIITKADLWEISIVTFPCNDSARITSVKSALQKIDSKTKLGEVERALRDSMGLTKSQAVELVSKIKSIALREREDENDAKLIEGIIKYKNEMELRAILISKSI